MMGFFVFFQDLCEFVIDYTAIKDIFFSVCLFFLLTITGTVVVVEMKPSLTL